MDRSLMQRAWGAPPGRTRRCVFLAGNHRPAFFLLYLEPHEIVFSFLDRRKADINETIVP
jgi:hypothetical protein